MNTPPPGAGPLAAFLGTRCADGGRRCLIIDSTEYAATVLLQGREIPWADGTAVAAHLAQSQALLKSAAVLLPLDAMIRWRLAGATTGDPLIEAMSAKSRPGYAARALLGDASLRDAVKQLAVATAAVIREPVLVHVPAPADLLTLADRAVNGADSGTVFDDDRAENAAVYLSDWLRTFAGTGVSGLVIDERWTDSGGQVLGPVLNVADHYQWPVAHRTADALRFRSADGGTVNVPVLDSGYWLAEPETVPDGEFLMTEIAGGAVPEQVLSRLAELRG